jgi:hypothetical protein
MWPDPSLKRSAARVHAPIDPLLALLIANERELHKPEVRRDRARLAELLHPEFSEIGRSGAQYTRGEVLVLLPDEQEPTRVHSQDFALQVLAEGVALLTYKAAHVSAAGELQRHALRSSVWTQGASGWQVLFHQGTPTTAFAQKAT